MINVIAQKVDACNRLEIPMENETIETDFPELFTTPDVLESISCVKVYLRTKEECPFNRGNWIIDILFGNEFIQCLKLPLSMHKDSVLKYIEPLHVMLEKIKMSNAH